MFRLRAVFHGTEFGTVRGPKRAVFRSVRARQYGMAALRNGDVLRVVLNEKMPRF